MASEDMVERCTVALFRSATMGLGKWADQKADIQAHYRYMARAAIEAMREPTDAMQAAMCTFAWDASGSVFDEVAFGAWSAGIDAALKERVNG